MASTTTGSTVYGCVQGMANGLEGQKMILQVNGNPDAVVTYTPTSGIAYDVTNGTFYMYKGGSTWSGLKAA